MTEEMNGKESFLSSLGLVTKEALSELQDKKYTRKRRSTANPHFSHAAIEAKRINQMELAAKKAQRKVQLADMKSTRPVRMSLYRRPETTSHLKTLSPSDTNKEKCSSLLAAKMSKVNCNCFVCSETCDTQLDVILFCSDCKCLFHATCAASLEEIISSGFVPCPKCDGKMSMEDELTSNDELKRKVAKSTPKPKPSIITAPPVTNKVKSSHKGNGDEVKVRKPKKLKTERTSTTSNASLVDRENGDPKQEKRKLHYEDKRKELESLMDKKFKLEQEWNERKKKLEKIREMYKIIQERSNKLESSNKNVNENIEKLVGFIKSVQKWQDIIDPDEGLSNGKQQNAQQQLPSMTITSIPAPVSSISGTSNGQPITLNIPMVTVTSNGQQFVATTTAAHVVDTTQGQPVISTTVASVGNKIISINGKPTAVNVPQVLPKVLNTSPMPVNSSNGTIEIVLQRVPESITPCMPVRNVSPGWVTVPVSSFAGKIIMPRIITSAPMRAVEPPKTQVDLHRTKKPPHGPASPYIPIVRSTIPQNNIKTYSGKGPAPDQIQLMNESE